MVAYINESISQEAYLICVCDSSTTMLVIISTFHCVINNSLGNNGEMFLVRKKEKRVEKKREIRII